MAAERPPLWQTSEALEIGELIEKLQTKWGVAVSGRSGKDPAPVELVSVDSQSFDKTFVLDLAIAVGIFVAGLVCLLLRLPVMGNPLVLLLGPLVGLILALKRRPPR